MNNLTTRTEKKSIPDQLRILEGVADSLTEAGVAIIIAEATTTRQPYILISHQHDELRQWAAENELDLVIDSLEKDEKSHLNFEIWTEINGIRVTGYMTDQEKEDYDNASV